LFNASQQLTIWQLLIVISCVDDFYIDLDTIVKDSVFCFLDNSICFFI